MKSVTNPAGGITEYEYNKLGKVTAVTDENGNRTEYAYTPNGNLSYVKDALGDETKYTYDIMGNLIKTERFGQMSIEEMSQSTIYEWNDMGFVTGIIDPLGNKEKYQYNKKGKVTDKWDRDGYHTSYSYDSRDLLTDILYADGTNVEYSYDSLRRLKEIKDSTGITHIQTDSAGRITSVIDSKRNKVSYEWGSMNEKLKLIYPDGKEVSYSYNEKGGLEALTTESGVIKYKYDNIGRIKQKILPNNTTTEYTYNSIGKLEEITHEGENFVEKYIYSYDKTGNKIGVEKTRTGIAEYSGKFGYEYDSLQRLTGVTRNGEPLRKYEYDAFGNRATKTEYNGGMPHHTEYRYNVNNQLITRICEEDEQIYTYDNRGNLTSVQREEDLLESYSFNASNKMSSASTITGGITKKAEYTYNGLGQRVSQSIPNNPEQEIHYILDVTRSYNNLLVSEE